MRVWTVAAPAALALMSAAAVMGSASCGECGFGSSCVADVPTTYSYPGCGRDSLAQCEARPVLSCAIETLQDPRRACTVNNDCRLVRFLDGCGAFSCNPPFAVSISEGVEFEWRAQAEVDRFCSGNPVCPVSVCAPPSGEPIAACRNQQCEVGFHINPQTTYTYAGCEHAGNGGCPNLLVFECALEKIEAKHGACVDDTDCASVDNFDTCVGSFTCLPPVVNSANVSAFLTEADTQRALYCNGGTCGSAPSCAHPKAANEPRCVQGRCVPIAIPADGGTSDSGM